MGFEWFWYVNVSSSVVINVPLWGVILIMGKTMKYGSRGPMGNFCTLKS